MDQKCSHKNYKNAFKKRIYESSKKKKRKKRENLLLVHIRCVELISENYEISVETEENTLVEENVKEIGNH